MKRETYFIGREKEKKILQEALETSEAEMVAVIGRRRVGKTYLIKNMYQSRMVFDITGLQNATIEQQLGHFNHTLSQHTKFSLPLQQANNWLEAFRILAMVLDATVTDWQEKKVVFFDELPWLAKKDSGFITGLDYFWNSWALNRNITVVVCGSSASWMIQNLVNNTGGLYNRITRRIFMQPFTLDEVKQYFMAKRFNFTNHEIVELYMAMGGIPHYLKEVKRGKSAIQNIDDICFAENGLLRDEFSKLYFSLFENAEKHMAIIRTLSNSRQGLTRQQIVRSARITENGNTTKVLEELEQSSFITSYLPYGKVKKDMMYRLTDEYSLFFLHFIEKNGLNGSGTWHFLSQTQEYKTWSGYAFENICLKHVSAIKKALGITGVYTQASTFYQKATESQRGAQIDLLLDRADNIINVFEIKYYNGEVTLTKEQADTLRRRLWTFAEASKTRKRLSLVMITAFGLTKNMHSLGLIEADLTLDDLF